MPSFDFTRLTGHFQTFCGEPNEFPIEQSNTIAQTFQSRFSHEASSLSWRITLQHQLAAVNLYRFADDVTGGVRGEKCDGPCAFHRRPDAAQRNRRDEVADHFRSREHFMEGRVD